MTQEYLPGGEGPQPPAGPTPAEPPPLAYVPGIGAIPAVGMEVSTSPHQPMAPTFWIGPPGSAPPQPRFRFSPRPAYTTARAGYNPQAGPGGGPGARRATPAGQLFAGLLFGVIAVGLLRSALHRHAAAGGEAALAVFGVAGLAVAVVGLVRLLRLRRDGAPPLDGVGLDRWGRPIPLAGSKTGLYDESGNPIREIGHD